MTCFSTCPCRCHGCTAGTMTSNGCNQCSQYHTFTGVFPIPNPGEPEITTHTHIEPFDYHPEIVQLLKSINEKLDKLLFKPRLGSKEKA